MLAVVGLLMADLLIRGLGGWLSQDLLHLREIPRIASSLAKSDGVRILFIGNSLIREGIDGDVVANTLGAHGIQSTICRVFPDDTTMATWYYVFKGHFLDDQRPDLVVVGFVGQQLADLPIDYRRLGGVASRKEILWEMANQEAEDLDARLELALGYGSFGFSNAGRVRLRVLDAVVPSYRQGVRLLNSRELAQRARRGGPQTYRRLRRFMEVASANGAAAVLLAMPQPVRYRIDEGAQHVLSSFSARLIDGQVLPGFSTAMYGDGYHLNRTGAQLLSQHVGELLTASVVGISMRDRGELVTPRFHQPGKGD